MEKNAETLILDKHSDDLSQPFPLILVGKKLVQVYHFSFILPQLH